MNGGFQKTVLLTGLAGLVLGAAYSAWAPPVRRGPSIQFSDAPKDTVSTNVSSFTDKKNNTLMRLEEDLSRPFQMLRPDTSSDSTRMVRRPPAGPVIQSKQIRELLDRQKNWVFTKPEDQLTGLTGEEMMNIPRLDENGQDQSEKLAFERYYEELVRADLGLTNRAPGRLDGALNSREEFARLDDPSDPARNAARAELNDTERGLRRLFNEEPETRLLPDIESTPVMPDLFDSKVTDTWQMRAQETRLDQFKQSLQMDLPQSTSPTSSGLPAVGTSLGPTTWGSSFGTLGTPGSRAPVTTPVSSFGGSSLSLPAPPTLSGAGEPAYTPPPPTRPPPSSPFLSIPKRKF